MVETVVISDVDQYGKSVPLQGALPNGLANGLAMGAGTFGIGDIRLSNIITLEGAAKLMVAMKLGSGELTIKVSIFNTGGSANFGAPDITLHSTDTGKYIDWINLPVGKSFQLQFTPGAAGGVLAEGFVLPMNYKPAGKDMRVLSYSWNLAAAGQYPDFAVAP